MIDGDGIDNGIGIGIDIDIDVGDCIEIDDGIGIGIGIDIDVGIDIEIDGGIGIGICIGVIDGGTIDDGIGIGIYIDIVTPPISNRFPNLSCRTSTCNALSNLSSPDVPSLTHLQHSPSHHELLSALFMFSQHYSFLLIASCFVIAENSVSSFCL